MKKILITLGLVLAVNAFAAESKEGEVKETDPCKTNDSKRSEGKKKAETKSGTKSTQGNTTNR